MYWRLDDYSVAIKNDRNLCWVIKGDNDVYCVPPDTNYQEWILTI